MTEVVDEQTVHARVGERVVTVSLLTLDGPAAPGEWLQVHSGFALARLTDDERLDAERIRNTTMEER
ncbi:HypC/HybG/HupF family hydrogenase formation chaperone [Nocardioides sp.]|uniref:HypC/HybG/HupF family hydrogenase formation chaperone n=1 Tax=Nocardioides sp. TaxID=35761 RepID=UPI001A1F52F4|nr:HypC/HybG/HupF family hydrogenase formation chaperone [Nocardioides sp.]MBJ7357819.1 HypC/HybG/HupF family hydrogenase formation chaperone [Nocardioides sp.]